MYLGYICLITVLVFLDEVLSIRFDANNPLQLSRAGVNEGIFERFLSNLFHLLSSPAFPGKELKKLCKLFYKETSKIKNRYGRKLARRFSRMSKMDCDEVKDEVQEYKKEFENKLPARTEFLKAMNEVFTLRENLLFEDYIYDLRDYGTDDKRLMDDETRKLVHEVIIGNVHKMGARDQIDLENKLKKAMKESDDVVDSDFQSFIDSLPRLREK